MYIVFGGWKFKREVRSFDMYSTATEKQRILGGQYDKASAGDCGTST